MSYIVKLDQFEGPLDLLLQLIEKEKLDITQISLAKITNQYLKYLEKLEEIDSRIICDFLVIAAKLLLIKSRYLLPLISVVQDEDEIDSKDLEERLFRYKKIKEQAKVLEELIKSEKSFYEHSFSFKKCAGFFPPKKKKITKEDLKFFSERLLKRSFQEEKFLEETITKTISFQEKIFQLRQLVFQKSIFSFQEVIKITQEKMEIVIIFLALLELIKQKEIVIEQSDIFEEITIRKNDGFVISKPDRHRTSKH